MNKQNEHMCPICGEGTLCTDIADDPKWGRAYCNRCDCGGPEVRTGYDENLDAPWREEARKQFVEVVNEHTGKRCLEWVKTTDRLPTKEDADDEGKVTALITGALTGKLLSLSLYYESVTAESADYFLPMPKLPEVEE
jgi:ribosomal protein S27AE